LAASEAESKPNCGVDIVALEITRGALRVVVAAASGVFAIGEVIAVKGRV
jgi:hypothetical protein